MLDTIVLLLDTDMFQIDKPDRFIPSARHLVRRSLGEGGWIFTENQKYNYGIYSRQNPTKKDLRNGIYKPRLTLFSGINLRNKPEIILKIELSLPKLLFGNNFEELQYKDRLPIIVKLVEVLERMGVITTVESIANAPVSTIHYSKNILLTDGSTPYHYINKIKEANIQLSLDVNQTDYRNYGHSYKWHCNSYEVVFYDKIKDLEKAKTSSKRSLEKDNEIQLDLFKRPQKIKKFEILRMEVRLNKRKKIRQLFHKLGIKADLTFKKLFKPAISKKILLHYMDELESKRPLLLDYKPANHKALLAVLIFNNPDLGAKQILQLYGLKRVLDVMSLRELRLMFASYSVRSWYRLMADINKIKLPMARQPFETIKRHILKFKPLKSNKAQTFLSTTRQPRDKESQS